MIEMSAALPLAPPQVGETIYLPSSFYIAHGRDDFRGGRCTVSQVKPSLSGGEPAVFISVEQRPGHSYNWTFLAREQEKLYAEFGDAVGRPDPDYSDEFNESWL